MAKNLYDEILKSFSSSTFEGIKREYAGQSGSPVFAVAYSPQNEYGLNGIFIVKVGSHSWALAEGNLYTSLKQSAFAPLLARCHMPSMPVGEQAAVAYGVAFDSLLEPQPLMTILDKEILSEHEARAQIAGLARTLVDWYLDSRSRLDHVTEGPHALLFRMLTLKRAGNVLTRILEALPALRADTLQMTIAGLDERMPNPLAYCQKTTWQRVQITYNPTSLVGRVHGDLHTGNVICSLSTQEIPRVIDFEQSEAQGVPFFDLAYLEFDILRHLLPVEQEEKRVSWLSLLKVSMAQIEGDSTQKLLWDAERAWNMIRPVRQEVRRLLESGQTNAPDQKAPFEQKDGEIVWWLATVAVGLNFARKGGQTSYARMAGLIYAAYGMARVLKIFDVKVPTEKNVPFVPWIFKEESAAAVVSKSDRATAERIRSALQEALRSFNAGIAVYQRTCDDADKALQELELFLQEMKTKTAQAHQPTSFLLNNLLNSQNSVRAALHYFRQACKPYKTRELSPVHYNNERQALGKQLSELLRNFQELLMEMKI